MSMIMKMHNILFFSVIVFICCAKPPDSNETKVLPDSMMTSEKAMKVAQDTATGLGYKLENMSSRVSFYRTPWNDYFPRESDSDYYTQRKRLLEGKSYWAVYYYPKQNEKGGDICVFVDAAMGNVLTLHRGK